MMRRIDGRHDSSTDVNREVSDVMKSPAASTTSPLLPILYPECVIEVETQIHAIWGNSSCR